MNDSNTCTSYYPTCYIDKVYVRLDHASIDEDIRDRLRSKLMQAVLSFEV